MDKSLIFAFFYLFIIISVVKCATVSFNSTIGQWNIANNWLGGVIPAFNDDVRTCSISNQKCVSSISKIGAGTIEVGSEVLNNCMFIVDKYGIDVPYLVINHNSSGYIAIKNDPAISGNSDYYANIRTVNVRGKFITNQYYKTNPSLNSTIQVYDGGNALFDATIMDIYMVKSLPGSIVSFQVNTVASLQGLRGDSSLTTITDSSVSIANNYIELSTNLNNSAILYCLNSSFVCHDVMNLYGKSELFFTNSNVSFFDDNANLFDTVGIYVEQGSSIFVRDSTFYSDKFIGNFDSYIDLDNSKAVINNDYFLFGNSILVVDKTNLTINHQLNLEDYSWVLIQNSSNVQVFRSIFINNDGLINGNRSTISIKSKKEINGEVLVLQLRGNGQLFFFEQSSVILEANINAGDYSTIGFNSTYVYFNSVAFFNSSSKFFGKQGSTIILDDNLNMIGNSSMYLENSSINIRGSIDFYDNAFLTMKQSTCSVDGYFSDRTSPLKQHYLAIINSKFNINGNFNSSGNIKLDGSTLECSNSFVITGGLVAYDTSIIIKNGNFSVGGVVKFSNSSVELKNGFVELNKNSELTLIKSNLIVLKGKIITSSNIYLNENCLFKNNGSIILSSSIYFTNDTSLKSNEVSISNDGEVIIINSTSINVVFKNSGSISVGNNKIYIYQFEQNNNGSILLDGGIIDSDSEFKINGGLISGNGLLNSSINQENGAFGSRYSTSRINISDNYIQSERGTIIINIDSIYDFSIFSIGNNVDIKGNIEIRINSELISFIRNSSKQSSSIDSSESLGTFNVINYKSKTDQSFNPNKIKFKIYSPNSNDDDQDADSCITSVSSSTSLSLLVGSNDCNNSSKKLSVGAIAGIVVGIVAAVVMVGVAFHYKDRLRLKVKYNKTVIRLSSKFAKK